jgi:hypothetical protein
MRTLAASEPDKVKTLFKMKFPDIATSEAIAWDSGKSRLMYTARRTGSQKARPVRSIRRARTEETEAKPGRSSTSIVATLQSRA